MIALGNSAFVSLVLSAYETSTRHAPVADYSYDNAKNAAYSFVTFAYPVCEY